MARRLYGFSASGELVQVEVDALRLATSRLLAKEKKAHTTRWMNAEGYRTTAGNLWSPEVLMRTLLNPRMAGLDADGNPVDGAPWAITPEERTQLLALSTKRESVEDREYLLTGGSSLCGLCRSPLTSSWAGANPIYRCPTSPPDEDVSTAAAADRAAETEAAPCGKISMNAELLETAVAEQVLAELLRPGALEHLEALLKDVEAEVGRLRPHLAQVDRSLAKITSMLRGQVPESARGSMEEAQTAARQDARDTRARLRYLEQIVSGVPKGHVQDYVRWWKAAPVASQRALVTLETSAVLVLPGKRGRGANPHDRIDIHWR